MKFSDERDLFAAASLQPAFGAQTAARRPDYARHLKAVFERGWVVLAGTLLALLCGLLFLAAARPSYEANLIIQIADAAGPAPKSFLGESANLFDIKTPAAAEMEILRSRMIVAPAMERANLAIQTRPRSYSLVGRWQTSESGLPPPAASAVRIGPWFWVPGARAIAVSRFEVPVAWEGQDFLLRSEGQGRYTLRHPALGGPLQGRVGELLEGSMGGAKLTLLVSQLDGDKGAQFDIVRHPWGKAIAELQDALKLTERARQSGVIEATMRDADPGRASAVLNAIGANYIRQDLDRKTAEAEKSIAFLNSQLPGLKAQMERAENAYSLLRARRGTVSPQDEAKIALEQFGDLRVRLADAQQRRRDLLSNLGSEHPAVRVVDQQVAGLQQELRSQQSRVSALPETQQDTQRLEREVRLSSDLYQQLRSSLLQLQLVRDGRSGNARVIDAAVAPHQPVWPKPTYVLAGAAAAGLLLSLIAVLMRSAMDGGVRSVRDIEAATGLNVYSSAIAFSKIQRLAKRTSQKLLAHEHPKERATAGMRQLRGFLQHQMRERGNNRLMITGPRRGVGVHFIGANLGAVVANAGRRVLLVDVDAAGGSLHQYFEMAGAPGLAELIAGHCARKEAVKPTGVPGLDLITAGKAPLDIDTMVSSRAFLELLEIASKEYDLVIITAPPVLETGDALTISPISTTVMLVARARKTLGDDITESALRLSQVGRLPGGVVLNAV